MANVDQALYSMQLSMRICISASCSSSKCGTLRIDVITAAAVAAAAAAAALSAKEQELSRREEQKVYDTVGSMQAGSYMLPSATTLYSISCSQANNFLVLEVHCVVHCALIIHPAPTAPVDDESTAVRQRPHAANRTMKTKSRCLQRFEAALPAV